MFEKLQRIQNETGQAIGWCHILPQKVPEQSSTTDEHELLSPISIKDSPISLEGIKDRVERVKSKLFVDPQQALKIEKETQDQSNSKLWYLHRQPRITASKCYRSTVIKETTSPTKAINEILYKKIVPTRQMKEGLEMEPVVMARYIKEQHKGGHEELSVSKSGLVVGKFENGFLGASPDGIVCDPSFADSKGLLEMKFIQTEEEESLEDALVRKQICVRNGSTIHMNKSNKYYYQIQQGMYLTETNWTDFVVAGSQTSEIYVERVSHDTVWWENIMKKLKLFFENHILPELAYPMIKYGLPRIDFLRNN
jgi:hypothetical protein